MAYTPGRRRVVFGRSRVTPAVAWLIGIEVGVFLLYLFSSEGGRASLLEWLALTPDSLRRGHIWKLATAPFLNVRGLAFFFDMLMLWLFIPVLENHWGSKRLIVFFAATSVVGHLASALVGMALAPGLVLVGLTPFIYGSIVAYGVLYAQHPVQLFGVLPIKGKALAIGTFAFVTLFVLLEGAWTEGAGFYAAMALAWTMTSGLWTPNVWWLKLRRWRLRRRYTVIDGGADRSKKRWMN